jgi:hypothetical protein
MLRWGPELDLKAGFVPTTRMEDETECDGEANKAALKILRELAAEYGLSHREALLILDTWSGLPDILPGEIVVKEQNTPLSLTYRTNIGRLSAPR